MKAWNERFQKQLNNLPLFYPKTRRLENGLNCITIIAVKFGLLPPIIESCRCWGSFSVTTLLNPQPPVHFLEHVRAKMMVIPQKPGVRPPATAQPSPQVLRCDEEKHPSPALTPRYHLHSFSCRSPMERLLAHCVIWGRQPFNLVNSPISHL